MELWILALIAAAAAVVLIRSLLKIKRQGMAQGSLAAMMLSGMLLTAAAVLLVLGLMLGISRREEPPDMTEATKIPTTAVTEGPGEASEASTTVTLPPMPEDYDLPLSEVPQALPDPHHVADVAYVEMPYFARSVDLSQYLLHCFLQGQFRTDFYMSRELAPSEGDATFRINQCIEAALSYYPFGAYKEYSLYIEEIGDPDFVLAHVDLRYENPD